MHLKTFVHLCVITCIACVTAVPCSAQQPAKKVVNTIGMNFTLVPVGEFRMGADEDPSDTLSAFPYARRE